MAAVLAAGVVAQDATLPHPSDTAISMHADPRLDADAFTIAVEVRLRSPREPQVFASRGARGELFTLYLYKGQVRMLVAHDAPEYTHVRVSPPELDRWTTLVGAYDGEQLRIWSDQGTASTRVPGRLAHGEAGLWIGGRENGADRVTGAIRRARFWDRMLTAEEATQVRQGEDVAPDHLVLDIYPEPAKPPVPVDLPTADGYRGIWYSNQPTGDDLAFKYSGGFGTYPQQHVPIAIHDPAANKTWFAFGARGVDGSLEHQIACLDHATFTVTAPRILLDKETTDAHDNPTLALDPQGHLLVFSNSHGTGRPSFVHRSAAPHDHTSFVRTWTTNFSYGQPWWMDGEAGELVFLHTLYQDGRRMLHITRGNGADEAWSAPRPLARMERGHYQVSWSDGNERLATAFNRHPDDGGLNARTDLHYIESVSVGRDWRTAAGERVDLPLTDPKGPSLVHAFSEEDRLVYLKDLAFDSDGRPVILFVTSSGWQPGPQPTPRRFLTARFDGERWQIRAGPEVDHNYDHGSLLVDADGGWRLIAPTGPGPQPWLTGGEVEVWHSGDRGGAWEKVRSLTPAPDRHHTYVRKVVDAHPDCEVVWADGDPLRPSDSRFWFATRDGRVFGFPARIGTEAVRPTPLLH